MFTRFKRCYCNFSVKIVRGAYTDRINVFVGKELAVSFIGSTGMQYFLLLCTRVYAVAESDQLNIFVFTVFRDVAIDTDAATLDDSNINHYDSPFISSSG